MKLQRYRYIFPLRRKEHRISVDSYVRECLLTTRILLKQEDFKCETPIGTFGVWLHLSGKKNRR
jgi:hypothetical protein